MRRTILVGLVFFSLRLFGGAEVIIVDPAGGGQFTDIQPALDAAQTGDTVLVKPGEYVLTESITFPQRAITLKSEAGADQTILRGAELPAPLSDVVVFTSPVDGAAIEGFTIRSGSRGVYIREGFEGPGPLIEHCRIQGNHSYGVLCEQSEPRLVDCTLADNSGSGLDFAESRPVLVRCTISGNQSDEWGYGGISGSYGTVTLTDCKITGNTRSGIYLDEAGGANLLRCEVSGNQHGLLAGWASGASLVNSRVTGNAGTGLSCSEEGGLHLTNCSVAGNGGPGIGFQNNCMGTVKNCIVWQNPIEITEYVPEGQVQVTYSIVEGTEVFPGEGNSNSDPLFAGLGDFRLQAGSPAIDSGTPDGAPATDIEGYARPCGAGVDMGAHEAGGCLPQAQAAMADPPDPVVQGNVALACAAALTLPGGDEEWTLDGAEFRNVGPGDAAALTFYAELYSDDGDGKLTFGQDTRMGSPEGFDPAAQTLTFSRIEHTMAPGSQMTFFLVCWLAKGPPLARALGGNGLRSAHEDGDGPGSAAAPLLALCGLVLILPALWSRRRLRLLLPGLVLLACGGFLPIIGCGGGSHHGAPEPRQLQMELTSLDVHGSPGLKIQVNGLPCQAWTFDA